MSRPAENLSRLVDLAKEPSSEKRRELLRDVTDLFLAEPQKFSESETAHFGAIMGQVAREMETTVRKQLAGSLAHVAEAPRNLILDLAADDIEVARPVLAHSPVLEEGDLIALAGEKGQDHLQALSSRASVSEALADAIVARADDNVLETLVKNAGASLSRGALETVVDRAETNARLQTPIAQRAELPPDLVNELLLFVTSAVKQHLMERLASFDEAAIERALVVSRSRIRRKLLAPSPQWANAERFIAQKERERGLTERLLVELAKAKRANEFIIGFSRLTDLDLSTAQCIITKGGAEALAIACKAARFDRSTFATFALLSDRSAVRSTDETANLLALYDKVPIEAAQRAMRFWKVRKQAMDAPAAAG